MRCCIAVAVVAAASAGLLLFCDHLCCICWLSMLQVVLISMLLLLAELNDTKRLYQEPWAESRARAYVFCLRM